VVVNQLDCIILYPEARDCDCDLRGCNSSRALIDDRLEGERRRLRDSKQVRLLVKLWLW
jgi:hypothetical protein